MSKGDSRMVVPLSLPRTKLEWFLWLTGSTSGVKRILRNGTRPSKVPRPKRERAFLKALQPNLRRSILPKQ
jgi:hypothetical protein